MSWIDQTPYIFSVIGIGIFISAVSYIIGKINGRKEGTILGYKIGEQELIRHFWRSVKYIQDQARNEERIKIALEAMFNG